MIITAYQTEKMSDDHPYIWRYAARRALVIFDHPYNAESALRADGDLAVGGRCRGTVYGVAKVKRPCSGVGRG